MQRARRTSASTTSTSTPRSPSALWAISRSLMFTPRSPARVVISASTPGRSGTGTRNSARRSGRTARAGSERRAAAAVLERGQQPGPVGRRPPGRAWRTGRPAACRGRPRWRRRSRRTRRARCRAARPPPGSCPGSPPRPAAAGRRARSAARSARFMSVAAVRCGTWETTATKRVVLLGRQGQHLGPEAAHHGLRGGHRRRGRWCCGGGEHPGGARRRGRGRPRPRRPARSRPWGGHPRSGDGAAAPSRAP